MCKAAQDMIYEREELAILKGLIMCVIVGFVGKNGINYGVIEEYSVFIVSSKPYVVCKSRNL